MNSNKGGKRYKMKKTIQSRIWSEYQREEGMYSESQTKVLDLRMNEQLTNPNHQTMQPINLSQILQMFRRISIMNNNFVKIAISILESKHYSLSKCHS